MTKKKSMFAKKGDPATRTSRKSKKKVKSILSKIPTGVRTVKPKRGVKKGIKRKKKSKFKLF